MSARADMHLTDAQVNEYVDRVMDEAAREEVERHLSSCTSCRSAVEETRAVVTTAQRERARVTAPAELWPMVAASTIHLAAMRRQVLASMRGALIVGAIALVAATAVVTWKVARWTAPHTTPESTAPASTAPPRADALGPGRHAGHAGHPTTIRTAPEPPRAPEAPRP
ncbi:MAG TPA: zf-HC2 domain-containing protein [Gemmatimonadaceae bacterium]